MSNVAIFVEGQSELIFVRHFLPQVIGWEKISFICFKLYSDRMVPAKYNYMNENAEIHFFIVDVGNDEKVLSAVKEREKSLFESGYEKIIALRDMYSKKYSKRSPRRIDENVTRAFIENAHKTIEEMSEPARIKMHFAIMELEAWFLGMYSIFPKINDRLIVEHIGDKLGFNLSIIDPQTEFFKPTDIVDNILQLVGLRYKKSEHDVESICSKINTNDFYNAF